MEYDVDMEDYDDSYDFENELGDKLHAEISKAKEIDPTEIDFNTANPDEINDPDQALQIVSYLQTVDKGMAEEMYYFFILDKFGWEEADPTEITNQEALLIASDFKLFSQYMFMCEYGFKFKTNWHHELLCKKLQDLFLGKVYVPRLIINMPPRFSKTQLLIYFVAWTMGHQQDSEYIWISYANRLSEESSFKIRQVLMHDKFKRIFELELDMSSKAKNDFGTTKRGKVYATSTGGTLTGKGAGKMRKSFGGAIIVDDGNNTLDAFSEANRDKANAWVSNTLLSRRNSRKYTPIIVIAQRVHENDISGFLLPNEDKPLGGAGEEFEHIEIPAILSKKQLEDFNVSENSPSYLKGDRDNDEYPLWPDSISLEELRIMRDNLPALTFYGQYQQQPFVGDGTIIQTSWLLPRDRPKDSEVKYRVAVIDTAQTKTKRSDFNVIMVAAILKDGTAFIESVFRKRMESPELTDEVLKMNRLFRPAKIYIEYKSSGINLIQYLKKEKVPLNIVPIPRNASAGDGDKVCRAGGVAPFIRAGYIGVPKDAPWLPIFFKEIMTFPNGTHDDMVDTLVDLVDREVVKGTGYLHPVDVAKLPLKGTTYAGVVLGEEGHKSIEDVNALDIDDLLGKYNYRGKPKQEDQGMDWSYDLF